jgi:hypothetical protein
MKKTTYVLLVISGIFMCYSCNNANARYVDLETGKKIELTKDESSGLMVNTETKKPVHIYVDTKNNDTIYGKTGQVINGHVYKNETGKFYFDDEIKSSDADVKIKTDDMKIKIEDGEKKVKKD